MNKYRLNPKREKRRYPAYPAVNCGHGSGICRECEKALFDLETLCDEVGLELNVYYEVKAQ